MSDCHLDISFSSAKGFEICKLTIVYSQLLEKKQSVLLQLAEEQYDQFKEGQVYTILFQNVENAYKKFADNNLSDEFSAFYIPTSMILCNVRNYLANHNFFIVGLNTWFELSFYHYIGFDQKYLQHNMQYVFGSNIFGSSRFAKCSLQDKTKEVKPVFARVSNTYYLYSNRNSIFSVIELEYNNRTKQTYPKSVMYDIETGQLKIQENASLYKVSMINDAEANIV